MKRIISLILLVLALSGLAAQAADVAPKVYVYRNDGGFNSLPRYENIDVTYLCGEVFFFYGDTSLKLPVQAVDSCVLRDVDVPELFFTFPDYPDVSSIWEKDKYLDATLEVRGNGYIPDMEGTTLKVKGRGNSTWCLPKKPMRLKFDKKLPLCGLKKAKNFALLANYLDFTHERNSLALWLANRLEMPYTNGFVPCVVYINGNKKGLFLLTEKVGINSGSVDIDENKGMLFEVSTEYDEDYKFKSEPYDLPVMVKDPDLAEICENDASGITPEELLASWQDDFNKALSMAKNGNGFEAFDMESLAKYLFVHEFTMNNEIMLPHSMYLYKESIGDDYKYNFGPVWDFDVAFNFINGEGVQYHPHSYHAKNALIYALMEDPEFTEFYKELVRKFHNEIFPEMLKFADEYSTLIEPAGIEDGVLWPEVDVTSGAFYQRFPSYNMKQNAADLREWMIERDRYMCNRYGIEY